MISTSVVRTGGAAVLLPLIGKQSSVHNVTAEKSNVDAVGVVNQIRLCFNLQRRRRCQCLFQVKNSSMAKRPRLVLDGNGNQPVHVCSVKPVTLRKKCGQRIRSEEFTDRNLNRRCSVSSPCGLIMHAAVIDPDLHLSPVVWKSERCACGVHSREARRIQGKKPDAGTSRTANIRAQIRFRKP